MDLLLSDFDSFSESSASEDQDDVEFLYGGQACSILSNLEETINKIDDLLSFERGFLHGDVVCLVTDPSGQLGRVVNVDMVVDLENINGSKIRGVNSKDLQKMRSMSVGDYVVKGPWLGKVDKVVDFVTILFDDGTKCVFNTHGPEKLMPTSPDLLEDSQYPFYPGQSVQVESSSVSKSSGWLCGKRKDKRDQGTVCAVDAGLVYVDWLGCARTGGDKEPAPPSLQDSIDLTLVSCFSHANWQVGDWCLLPMADHKNATEQTFCAPPACGLGEGGSGNMSKKRSNFQDIAVIVKAKTKVDVLWQDGSQSFGLDSHSLISVNVVDAHDFWPEQLVLENGTGDDMHVPDAKRWGVVRSVDAKERTVKVRWITCAPNELHKPEGEQTEETVSAYELVEHPDYSFCFGDAVFRLQNDGLVDLADEESFKNQKISKISIGQEIYLKSIENSRDQNEFPSSNYLSCIGIVVDFKDGDIKVKWATGATSMVRPYEIYRIDKCEALSFTSLSHDEHDEQTSEQVAIPENQSYPLKAKEMLDFYAGNENCEKTSCDSTSYSLHRSAMEIFSSITSTLLQSLGTSLFGKYERIPDVERAGIPSNEEALELSYFQTGGSPSVIVDLQDLKENSEQIVEEANLERDLAVPSNSMCQENFKQFDMVSGCLDHHFVGATGKGLQFSQVKNCWLKKVQQEWSILEKELPNTIYIRVYEERMDLLRAAIVGAPGTPYHDGLFFFDISLPPEYPQEPPMVYYNSGGLRLNPNLYESGKVCLSLLNTWTGSGSEVWTPGSSTILQVLLSLQALVLNEKPYFNEAGYDSQIGKAEGEKNSVSYNENAFLLSCKSMLYIISKPPKHFEALVEEHFSRHCKDILSACKVYMEGAPVGSAFEWKKTEQENQKGSSTGFKIMLGKLFPKLVEAFSEKGIDCSHSLDQGEWP